jgi:hypothetical protein
MRTLSTDSWKQYQRLGRTHIASTGQRYILVLERETQATVLEPVNVIKVGRA